MSEEGLTELALDALANLEDEEYDVITASSSEAKELLDSKQSFAFIPRARSMIGRIISGTSALALQLRR